MIRDFLRDKQVRGRGKMDIISILILIAVPALGTLKVLLQGVGNKHGIHSTKDSLTFTGIYFLSLAVFVAIFFLKEMPAVTTIMVAMANGLLNVIFQVSYIMAFNVGPVAITGTIIYFNMLLPLLFGIVYLNEPVTVFKVTGILMILIAFILLSKKEKDKKFSFKWLALIMCAFITAGSGTVLQSLFKTLPSAHQRNEYLVVNYTFAAIVCFVVAMLMKKKDKTKMEINRYTILGPIAIGVVLGIYQVLTMYGLAIMDVSIFYPIMSALSVIFLLITGIFVFKERPTVTQYIGVGIGVIAVILVNL